METTDRGRIGRYESAALWIAAILMLVATSLYAWLAGSGPAGPAPVMLAGTVHTEPAAVAVPEAVPDLVPSTLDEAPAEPVPTF